jgi:hypothetical protein
LHQPRNAASECRMTSVDSGRSGSIPDVARLVAAVLERSTGKGSSIHGESHWQRVAAAATSQEARRCQCSTSPFALMYKPKFCSTDRLELRMLAQEGWGGFEHCPDC